MVEDTVGAMDRRDSLGAPSLASENLPRLACCPVPDTMTNLAGGFVGDVENDFSHRRHGQECELMLIEYSRNRCKVVLNEQKQAQGRLLQIELTTAPSAAESLC